MKKITTMHICILALATALNFVGVVIALVLRLPIYLDSIGTMLAASLLGPFYGMIPGVLNGILSGMTTDVYSFYYIPVQLVTGFTAGIIFQRGMLKSWKIFPCAALISIPGTVIGSVITALLFHGVTSSGSTVLVQLLHGAGLNLTVSICLVQAITDYVDKAIILFLIIAILAVLPHTFKASLQKGAVRNGSL